MTGFNSGWIKLHRKFLDSPIWQTPNLARFWTWCLLKASHNKFTATIRYSRITLEPGQFLYNHPMASMETGLSLKVVRSCLEALQNHDDPEIGQEKGRQTGRHFSIVTILKWRDYQDGDTDEGRQTGAKRAGKGQAEGRLYYKVSKECKETDRCRHHFQPYRKPNMDGMDCRLPDRWPQRPRPVTRSTASRK
jgi:hypothetical protein